MAYDDIQSLIDMGKGFAAQELGPPHTVYRFSNPDNTGNLLITGNQIATNFNALVKIAYGAAVRTSFEGEREQGILWYEVIADMTDYCVNDIFILTDSVYGAGYSSVPYVNEQLKGFSLADHSPIKKIMGGHLNTTATFQRMNNQGIDTKNRFGSTTKTSLPMIMTNSIVSIGSQGAVATQFPVGIMSSGRSYGDRQFTNSPGDERRSGAALYVPAFQGLQFREGDRVIAADGTTYTVVVVFVQKSGLTGWQLFIERDTSGAG